MKAGDKLMLRENVPLSMKWELTRNLVENGLTGKNDIPVV